MNNEQKKFKTSVKKQHKRQRKLRMLKAEKNKRFQTKHIQAIEYRHVIHNNSKINTTNIQTQRNQFLSKINIPKKDTLFLSNNEVEKVYNNTISRLNKKLNPKI